MRPRRKFADNSKHTHGDSSASKTSSSSCGLPRDKLASITTPDQRSDGGASSPTYPHSRKRDASIAGFDGSPGSVDSPDHDGTEDGNHKKRPVKRACNECRQQKLRCDVIQKPFQICTRCKRLRLECKIEENFKRIGKRSRNAEMEREIVELRKQVAAQNTGSTNGTPLNASSTNTQAHTNEAAAGLLDLRDGGRGGAYKRLGDVVLQHDRIQDTFQRFFKFCHPFLPFLNPKRTPDEYYARSPLLFWTIVLIGARHFSSEPHLFSALARQVQTLIWATMADVPQNYQVVKALILLCAWPLPCSSTSTDLTFLLSGLMMQVALQIGLHRPDHAQDFTKFHIELRQAELQDRVVVWSVCNMVAQRIATAYGQPPSTVYDWTLGAKPIESNPNYELPPEIYNRLQIERFVDKVSRTVYSNSNDPVGLPDDHTRSGLVRLLAEDLKELEARFHVDESEASVITKIYLKAAALHLHLSAFFSHRDIPSYRTDMFELHRATIDFLEACLSLESAYSINLPSNYSHGLSLSHGTNYIFHMMLAGGFSLLKLMHHFLPQHNLDTQGAAELLTRTLWALRSASVVENDLPERLSEVLAQVWKSGPKRLDLKHDGNSEEPQDELQLKVRCRMSMSLVFDSVWRWRKNFIDQRPPPGKSDAPFQLPRIDDIRIARYFTANGEGTATDPTVSVIIPSDSNKDVSMTVNESVSDNAPSIPGMAGMPTGIADDFVTDPYAPTNYEVFDPLNWMLDGTVDFPFSFAQSSGIDQMNALTADM